MAILYIFATVYFGLAFLLYIHREAPIRDLLKTHGAPQPTDWDLTSKQLRTLGSLYGIKNASRMRKAELIAVLSKI